MAEADSDAMEWCDNRHVCERVCEVLGVASTEDIYYIDRMASALKCAKCPYRGE